jgi:hypothetical protein
MSESVVCLELFPVVDLTIAEPMGSTEIHGLHTSISKTIDSKASESKRNTT